MAACAFGRPYDLRMIELARTVRFSLPPAGDTSAEVEDGHNTFACWPAMRGFASYHELTVTCRGEPDPRTGYLVNISEIDDAVRRLVLPLLRRYARTAPQTEPATVLPALLATLGPPLGKPLFAVRWRLCPYYSLAMSVSDPKHVLMVETFEFAAAHRLHSPELSDEENRRIFGKCNNPSGHGHNYHVEVAVASPFAKDESRLLLDNLTLERIVNERIVERFDHRHLDRDTEEFARLNSTVENIARVCFHLLESPLSEAGGVLKRITVRETEKTSCTYPAD